MTDVRSPAAQSGYVDAELLIHQFANVCRKAQTGDELDDLWRAYIKPVESQLSANVMGILENIQALNRTIILLCARSR